MKKKQYIWMAVTADEYEHPIAVADTAEELGRMIGVSRNTILTDQLRGESGKISGRRIVRVNKNEE